MDALIKKQIALVLIFVLGAAFFFKKPIREIRAKDPQRIQIKGKLVLFHGDDFINKKSRSTYQIEKSNGQFYQVRFLKNPPKDKIGSWVTIDGSKRDSKLIVASGEEPHLKVVKPFLLQSPTGEIKTLVILFNFTNNLSQPFTRQEVYSAWFTAQNSVKAYFQEASFNKTYITGDVTDWLTIPFSNDQCNLNWRKWSDKADEIASARGYNPENYQRKVYIFPTTQSCSYEAWTHLNGDKIWINGINMIFIYLHELGHTFGLEHANSLSCKEKQIDDYSRCQIYEYGDPFDIMGAWNAFHTNAANKVYLGWIPLSRVREVNKSGYYTLYPLEMVSFEPQALRISKRDTAEFYYLEYRQPIGFDSSLPKGITSGTTIHIRRTSGETLLIDANPEYPFTSFQNAALVEGIPFIDPKNKIVITQVGHSPTAVTLHINLETCDSINAYVSPNPVTKNRPISFTFTSNLGYTEIDFDPGKGVSSCSFDKNSAKCTGNPTGDGKLCWWRWNCLAAKRPGNFTAAFTNIENCPKTVSYTVVAPTPTPTPTPSPDTVSPNKAVVKGYYSRVDDKTTPWDEANALIFLWRWRGDRTCTNCQPAVGFCKPNGFSSGKTKISCNPKRVGPFWWQIADETSKKPRVYYYHSGYKQNVTLPNGCQYPSSGTKFVVSCKGKKGHTFRIDIQTRDAQGNITGKVGSAWPDNVWTKATCP